MYAAWIMLIVSLIGWPVSVVWLAPDEPIFILSLSWLAITITAWDIVSTADVRVKQEEEDPPTEE